MTASSEPRIVAAPVMHRPVTVRSWPARDAGWWAVVSAGGLCASAALLGLTCRSWLVGAAGGGLVAFASWRYWLPVYFDLDASGITQRLGRRRWRIPWTAIGGYALRPQGVALWAADAGSLAASARAIVIPWNGQSGTLLAAIAEHLGPPTA
ncbi:MAG: hypothetical protein U0836_04765 [Pirellulales bacterium]